MTPLPNHHNSRVGLHPPPSPPQPLCLMLLQLSAASRWAPQPTPSATASTCATSSTPTLTSAPLSLPSSPPAAAENKHILASSEATCLFGSKRCSRIVVRCSYSHCAARFTACVCANVLRYAVQSINAIVCVIVRLHSATSPSNHAATHSADAGACSCAPTLLPQPVHRCHRAPCRQRCPLHHRSYEPNCKCSQPCCVCAAACPSALCELVVNFFSAGNQ